MSRMEPSSFIVSYVHVCVCATYGYFQYCIQRLLHLLMSFSHNWFDLWVVSVKVIFKSE